MRRRELVAAAVTAGALARPAAAAAQAAREAEVLTLALRLEHEVVFAYDRATPLLRGAERRLAERLRGHEERHAAALAQALTELHWPLPAAPRGPGELQVPQLASGVAALRDAGGARSLLVEAERLERLAYRAGIARLREGKHLQLAATILAAEATHQVAWRAVR